MEYPFITLGDGTQISHSEMLADRSVLVYIRKDAFIALFSSSPRRNGARSLGCRQTNSRNSTGSS